MDFDLLTPANDSIEEIVELLGGDAGLLRVVQKATRADSLNSNGRIYPRAVLQKAIDDARQTAQAGAMLSELEHPPVGTTPAGAKKFVDSGGSRKTARVDGISDIRADGWVTITRTILDTPAGRQVAEAYRAGKPLGISTRFEMRGHAKRYNGRNVVVADDLHIYTFDDVASPAVAGAGEPELLGDSVVEQIMLSGSDNNNNKAMKKTALQKALDLWKASLSAEPPIQAEDVMGARTLAYDAIKAAIGRKEDVEEVIKAAHQLEADTTSLGFVSGRPAPTFTGSRDLGIQMVGWGADVQVTNNTPTPTASVPTSSGGLGDSADPDRTFIRSLRERQEQEAAQAAIREAVDQWLASADSTTLPESHRDWARDRVCQIATSPEQVPDLMALEADSLSKLTASMRLSASGGTTVTSHGRTFERMEEAPVWMQAVDHLCQVADDYRAGAGAKLFDRDELCPRRRAYNRKTVIDPLLKDMLAQQARAPKTMQEWFNESDSLATPLADGQSIADALHNTDLSSVLGDSTTTANLMNQPVISTFMLIQSFQDMKFLQHALATGPGASGMEIMPNNDPRIGKVIRVASEYLTAPTSYGILQNNYTGGLLVPENTGIPEIVVGTYWTYWNTVWRRSAFSLTAEAIREIGHGPLNYPTLARHLYHKAYLKSRIMDKVIGDEMLAAADEYGTVTVTTESPSLADQSEYLVTGSVVINMNPAKTAVAAVAAGDMSRSYGANVVAAIRLKTRGNGTSSPYMGTASGADPIVTPKVKVDYTAAGAQSSSTLFPFTIAGAGAQVEGYLDDNGQIQTKAGGASPTYAVDWEYGVVVFNAAGYTAAGWGNAAGVLTGGTATFTYNYSTNHSSFIVGESMVTLGTGQTWEEYLSGLFRTVDVAAALMGSAPRFVAPNLGLMSLNASVNMTAASIFWKLISPKGTELFPTEDFFVERTGIRFARHNSPWRGVDRRILLTRQGTTHYHIDTPFEVRGPYPAMDGGLIVARDLFYAQENNLVATPQPVDSTGAIINPVARTIILRS